MSESNMPSLWSDALLIARLLAIDPHGLRGACIHGRPGSARDAWLDFFRAALPAQDVLRRVPMHTAEDRLLGSLDLVATLQQARPVHRRGVLAECDGGFLVLPMAERIPPRMRAHLTAVLDTDQVIVQRDGLALTTPTRIGIIALDESLDDEDRSAPQLLDRLAFLLDLSLLPTRLDIGAAPDATTVERARALLPHVGLSDALRASLCTTAGSLGIASIRASIMALRAACALAALDGRACVSEDDAKTAARLVLAPRATQLPPQLDDQESAPPDQTDSNPEPADQDTRDADTQRPPREPPPHEGEPPVPPDTETNRDDASADDGKSDDAADQNQVEPSPDDLILAATLAAIPAKLLQQIAERDTRKIRGETQGRAGAVQQSKLRGRPAGVRAGKPGGGERLNLIETLRAAAPWQSLRRASVEVQQRARLHIRSSDLRVTRYKQRTQTTTIFVVDASGSAALNRLAEAKGAVELILADCYVRRDQVSVIAFRGRSAELLLPPTRSLLRAKRNLAGLPGGGGTPLASGMQAGISLAEQVRRSGQTPTLVLLTDGCGNVALDGTPGRQRADADVQATAIRLRAAGIASVLIDISNRGQVQAQTLARTMNARYVWLPYADAARMSKAIKEASNAPVR